VRLHDRNGRVAAHEVAEVAAAGVVGLQPALELGVEISQASEVLAVEGQPVELLERGALEAFADRVVVGRPGRDAMLADAEMLKVAGERLAGELGAVEFLTVVKVVGWGQAGGGTGGIVERLATPCSVRSSRLRWRLRALLTTRRAARISGGTW
jgi:hypothetical protein